ncbi:hypothetical protein OUZ56_005547 [Daphnia magna]|uniref:Uncharacterized protein n=1 Tax=Daphnia magna TaxID=35525 RepID=A0ABQ9YT40_9CRUS|nr:hypothetical protein OUZ56_005547 [Daphnia magna]
MQAENLSYLIRPVCHGRESVWAKGGNGKGEACIETIKSNPVLNALSAVDRFKDLKNNNLSTRLIKANCRYHNLAQLIPNSKQLILNRQSNSQRRPGVGAAEVVRKTEISSSSRCKVYVEYMFQSQPKCWMCACTNPFLNEIHRISGPSGGNPICWYLECVKSCVCQQNLLFIPSNAQNFAEFFAAIKHIDKLKRDLNEANQFSSKQ